MGGIKGEIASAFRSLSIATTISLSVVISMFAGVITGYYLDNHLFNGRTYPWLTLIFMGFGIAGGVKNFLVLSKKFSREAEEDKNKGDGNEQK